MSSNDGARLSAITGVAEWLEAFASCVRNVDYAAARDLIDDEVVSFGTFNDIIVGRDEWERSQFREVWPTTQVFQFDLSRATFLGDGKLVTAIVPWTSTGFHADGAPFNRPGRATMVLRRANGRWRCVHSHMSLCRGVPQRSYAPQERSHLRPQPSRS